MSGSAEASPKSQRSPSSSSSTASLSGLEYQGGQNPSSSTTASLSSTEYQGGQDLSHWEEPGGHLRDEQPGGYLREDMFVTAPERILAGKLENISSPNLSPDMFATASERIINDELDKIPSPEVETASQFFDRKTRTPSFKFKTIRR